jgi:hypothetical protein
MVRAANGALPAAIRACLLEARDPDRASAMQAYMSSAIGRPLRQHAYVEPRVVERYVKSLGPRLAPLARREAMKHLGARRRRP